MKFSLQHISIAGVSISYFLTLQVTSLDEKKEVFFFFIRNRVTLPFSSNSVCP